MNKFYMRQKIFSIGDKYNIYDENNCLCYYCKGDFFSITSKLHLFSKNDNELFYIRKKILAFLPTYQLFKNDEEVAKVHKKLTLFTHTIDIDSKYGCFTIKGDFLAHDFQILRDNIAVCEVHKQWISFGDSYCITIYDDKENDFFIALIILIDNCLHDNTSNSTSYTSNNN